MCMKSYEERQDHKENYCIDKIIQEILELVLEGMREKCKNLSQGGSCKSAKASICGFNQDTLR